jgi:amidophosphoribosyltransferase
MLVFSEKGTESRQLSTPNLKFDVFEYVYFARPDSIIESRVVDLVRQKLGRILFRENRIEGDLVVPVPDSGIPAAFGFSQASGIPLYPAILKNRYIDRTFINPEQHLRERGVDLKLNPMPHMLAGKDVVLVDDSIVRGTTSQRNVEKVRQAGARRVHLVISSPPYSFPHFYGIDTPSQRELIAFSHSIEEIRRFIGADSLHYLSFEGLVEAIDLQGRLCTSVFRGDYPIDIGERRSEVVFGELSVV